MMFFRQLFDHDSYTYTYIIADDQGGEKVAVIIDPVLEKLPLYEMLIEQYGLNLKYTIETHVHADHITASGELRSKYACETIMGKETKADCVSRRVSDAEVVEVGVLNITALATPGHTDDSYSFHLRADGEDYLFTGDTLFIRGTGRTDFQSGSAADQYHSLFDKLLAYPDDTRIFPAHDYKGMTESTVGEEKQFNPRLQVSSKSEYVELMENLDLPNPKYMDVAVPANLQCGKK
jgi:sulfur dioxygenase